MRVNATARGLLIIAAVAGVITVLITVLPRWVTLDRLVHIAQIAFIVAMAYCVYLMWRERREGIATWPQRAQWVFYGSAAVAVADVAVYWYGSAHGMQVIAFVAILALCGLAMVRTWREQHRYV